MKKEAEKNKAEIEEGTLAFGMRLLKQYPSRSFVVLVSFLLAGLMEGLGASSLFPLLSLMQGAEVGDNLIIQSVDNALTFLGIEKSVPSLLILIVVLIFLKAVCSLIAMRFAGYATADMAHDLRLTLLRSMMTAKWSYFSTLETGRSANALITEADRAATGYLYFCKLLSEMMLIVVYITLAFLVMWQITLAAIFAGFVIMGGFYRLISVVRNAGKQQTTYLASLSSLITDVLGGMKSIKAMGQENYFLGVLSSESQKLREAYKTQVMGREVLSIMREPLIIIFVAAGIYTTYSYAGLSLTVLIVFAFMFLRVVQKLTVAQLAYQKVSAQESAYWSLLNSIENAQSMHEDFKGKKAATLKKGIHFHDVSFFHQRSTGEPVQVLNDINIDIVACRLNAIVGLSGSGKTTLTDLILGFYLPDKGEITIDDTPVKDMDIIKWRNSVGYVPQDSFLLHDTIYYNITLGDKEITRQDVEAALRQVDAWPFVKDLPEGIDTVVGERGSLFSGGQRQRIALARAIVRKPLLLLLDEATSALDAETEQSILKTLKNLSRDITLIMVSHNVSILDYADNVFKIESGVIKKTPERG